MDIEFHYYMTHLIGTRAGLGADDARTVAHASQYVDDNDIKFEIDKSKGSAYRNYISQTMNILKPKASLLRIYPLFHFIPGDPQSRTAWRKDGQMHWLNTTPDSKNANAIMDAAIASGDLYRIGIAAHSYVDTWAHQNFIGYYDDFNSMETVLGTIAPNIGHADAGHNPDWPALVWRDPRLINERVDNQDRFMRAAGALFVKLAKFANPRVDQTHVNKEKRALVKDLRRAIGEQDQENAYRNERIARYRERAETANYGDATLPLYDDDLWFDEAVNEKVRGLRDRGDNALLRFDPLTDRYTWKKPRGYRQTDWYKFQVAVKAHQNVAWEVLEGSNLKGLELEAL